MVAVIDEIAKTEQSARQDDGPANPPRLISFRLCVNDQVRQVAI